MLRDALLFRSDQIVKLVTREDKFNIHKTLGIVALGHYIFRFYEWAIFGYIKMEKNDIATLYFLIIHSLLSISSLIFHIPSNRIKSAPMIWPEFRFHSIIFAMRSFLISMLIWYNYNDIYRKYIVFITMILADYVILKYRKPGITSTRGMHFPDYISDRNRIRINYFYSISQVFATMEVLARKSIASVFMIAFPIQIAPFLMTLTRKSIITSGGWHFYYSLSLIVTFLYSFTHTNAEDTMTTNELITYFYLAISFIVLRFYFKINKYVLWGSVFMVI